MLYLAEQIIFQHSLECFSFLPLYLCLESVSYKKKKSFFGIITQHEGFYENNVLSEDLISNKEILDKGIYVIEDNKVYHKPHISMIMSNKKEYNKYGTILLVILAVCCYLMYLLK